MMIVTKTIRVTAAGLIAAGAVAPFALAGGEPKNELPFTRSVGDRTPAQLRQSQSAQAAVVAGEPKNQLPFTRPIAARAISQVGQSTTVARVGNGEAKNEQPFTQPAAVPTIVVRTSGGFDWGDAGIGVAAGLGIALALVGGLLLVSHRSPRARKIGAAATR